MRPRLAAVSRFVHAIAGREIGTTQSFTAADINNVRIGGSKSDCTDRPARLTVKDGIPGSPEVVGLPHASVVGSHKENVRLVGNSGDGHCAPGAKWANVAPAQFLIWS